MYLPAINPISDPALDAAGILTFRNAAVDAGVAKPPQTYRAAWSTFDNASGATRPLGETSSQTARLNPPADLPSGSNVFIRVDVTAAGGTDRSWETPVRAYFRRDGGSWRLVGFERSPAD